MWAWNTYRVVGVLLEEESIRGERTGDRVNMCRNTYRVVGVLLEEESIRGERTGDRVNMCRNTYSVVGVLLEKESISVERTGDTVNMCHEKLLHNEFDSIIWKKLRYIKCNISKRLSCECETKTFNALMAKKKSRNK